MRSALVTGGSSGIGLAIARMLRAEGFALTLAARTPERLAAAASELSASSVVTDVRSADDCERAVATHVAAHGGLDVLVNSAGVGIAGGIDEQDVKRIDLQLDVNLRGLILVTRAAIPHLRVSHGLIVNLASIAGTEPVPELPVYAATKAAVISLTHTLNATLDADGVRVHALCPDYVDTLSHIEVPTLIVVGQDDEYTPVAEAQLMHRRIRQSRLVIIEGAAHLPNLERPSAFNAALQSFLDGDLGRKGARDISRGLVTRLPAACDQRVEWPDPIPAGKRQAKGTRQVQTIAQRLKEEHA